MIRDEDRRKIRGAMWWSLGVATGSLRAHDVGIGLAVAWARRRGRWTRIVRMAEIDKIMGDDSVVLVGSDVLRAWPRGPVVERAPYTDARVAFGIALAQHGPWNPCSLEDGCMYSLEGAHVHPGPRPSRRYYIGSMGTSEIWKWTAVDPDPRRWNG